MSKGKDMFRRLSCSAASVAVCVWNEEAEGVRRSEGWGAGGFRWTGNEGFSFSGHPEDIRWMALPPHSGGSWVVLQSQQTGTVTMNRPQIPSLGLLRQTAQSSGFPYPFTRIQSPPGKVPFSCTEQQRLV